MKSLTYLPLPDWNRQTLNYRGTNLINNGITIAQVCGAWSENIGEYTYVNAEWEVVTTQKAYLGSEYDWEKTLTKNVVQTIMTTALKTNLINELHIEKGEHQILIMVPRQLAHIYMLLQRNFINAMIIDNSTEQDIIYVFDKMFDRIKRDYVYGWLGSIRILHSSIDPVVVNSIIQK